MVFCADEVYWLWGCASDGYRCAASAIQAVPVAGRPDADDAVRAFLFDIGVVGTEILVAVRPVRVRNPDRVIAGVDMVHGQFLQLQLQLYRIKDAVLVPEEAIGKDTKGNFVLVAGKSQTAELRRVELGQQHGNLFVVQKGIASGEKVVTEGKNLVNPGDKFKVKQ